MKNSLFVPAIMFVLIQSVYAEVGFSWRETYQFEYSISSYSDPKRLELMKSYLKRKCQNRKCEEGLSHQLSYLFYKRSLKNNSLKYQKSLKKMINDLKEIQASCREDCENRVDVICSEYDRRTFLAKPFCLSAYQVHFIQKIQ